MTDLPYPSLLQDTVQVLSSDRVVANSREPMGPSTIFINREGCIQFIQKHADKKARQDYLERTWNSQEAEDLLAKRALTIEDYGTMALMPGIIDSNVNLQDMAKEKWEGFEHGTAAAAAGGVTTIVDLPVMKRPSLTSVKNLQKHIEEAEKNIKVDVAFLAYLSDDYLSNIEGLIENGIVFGFCSFLSAPLNRKLDEITEKGLLQAIESISQKAKDMVYYLEPILSEGRHMYAKSPFRKEKPSKRLSQDIPKTLNLMGFAFPDGNEGDNSSESEDDAQPQLLSIEKLESHTASKGASQGNPHQTSFLQLKETERYEEPSSAQLRTSIKEMREDVQNLAQSELMMYETNTSSNIRSPLEEHKENQLGSASSNQSSKRICKFNIHTKSAPQDPSDSSGSCKSLKIDSKRDQTYNQSNSKTRINKKLTIRKSSIVFNPKGPVNNNGHVDDSKSPSRNVPASQNQQIQAHVEKAAQTQSSDQQISVQNLDIGRQQESQSEILRQENKSSSSQQKLDSLASINMIKHARKNSSILDDRKISPPLISVGALGSGKNNLLERRRQLLAQKQEPLTNNQTEENESQNLHLSLINQGSNSTNGTPLKSGVLSAPHFLLPQKQSIELVQQRSNSGFARRLIPLNTNKKEESDDSSLRMQCNYKFFLSLQPVSFEEYGVAVVEKITQIIPRFKEEGCKIHLMNLSSNIGLDKARQLKKSLDFQKVTYEITPHHLLFSAQDIKDKETVMKCCPPIRDIREQNLLVIGFKKHYFDCISSGHFPVDPMYKQAGGGNFFKAFNGVSTLGFSLQAMWTLFYNRSEMFSSADAPTIKDVQKYFMLLVQMLCEGPAQMLGLSAVKGSLEEGKQADIVVFDPDHEQVIAERDILNRFPQVSIYRGKTLRGKVKCTYLRGKKIFSDSDSTTIQKSSAGKVLRRKDYQLNT